jgi:hypothetical protein
MTYANDAERAQLVVGLRALADFLEDNPSLPVPQAAEITLFPQRNADTQMRSEIDQIADLLSTITS